MYNLGFSLHQSTYSIILICFTRCSTNAPLVSLPYIWAYGVVVSMFDFHRSDQGSNPGRGGKIS